MSGPVSASESRVGFVCQRCGNCCRAPGYVHLLPGEGEVIAALLGISERNFFDRYTRLTADRRGLSLTEASDGSCIFLQPDNLCRIDAAKPAQCRDYPALWNSELLDAACAGRVVEQERRRK